MESVLSIEGLQHRYGETVALAGVDLNVRPGECVALLGPNGAGKTTLVHSAIGLIDADSGTIRVAGGDTGKPSVRRRMGVVQQEVGFPRTLTVWEVVSGAADRAGVDRAAAIAAINEMGLSGLERRRAGRISGGQQQRLQLAMGLVANPVLLILDEPTVGLDVRARHDFWTSIRARRDAGTGVLLTTHVVDEAGVIADRVVVIDRGRVVAEGSPSELRRTLPDRRIEAVTTLRAKDARAIDGVVSVDRIGDRLVITTSSAEPVTRWLLTNDPSAHDLTITTASLDEVLMTMTEEVAA